MSKALLYGHTEDARPHPLPTVRQQMGDLTANEEELTAPQWPIPQHYIQLPGGKDTCNFIKQEFLHVHVRAPLHSTPCT